MTLFLLLLVPVIIGLVGLWIGKGTVTWKEFLVQEVAVTLLIVGTFFIAAHMRTADKEIWNGVITSKTKENTNCCHSYPCNCHEICSGSGSNRSCTTHCDTCYRHSHDVEWNAYTSNGEKAYHDGCNAPSTNEPQRFTDIIIGEPTAIEHSYTNYIKGNQDTILKRVVTDKQFNIPEYPKVYDYYRATRFIGVGINDARFTEYNKKLDEINGRVGAPKQVDVIVIVVNESDQLYFEKLKEEWLGGKKNDFIVVVGAPEYPKIAWANVMSWSDSEDAKVFTKNRIMELKEFDGDKILKIIDEEVSNKFVRKEMKDFEYLKARIQPTTAMNIIIFILGTILSVTLTVWFKNKDVL